jgi:glucose-6-phosphate 1-dehydrogenase
MQAFQTFVLFGATGDLAQRMLLPSLYNLAYDGLLGEDVKIIAVARGDVESQAFREAAARNLKKYVSDELYDDIKLAHFLARLDYIAVQGTAEQDFALLKAHLEGRMAQGVAYYLSTPPSQFVPIAQGLAAAGLGGTTTRIAMEKPIGQDLASSRVVNDALATIFHEDQVFRVDHYLGKETVQNLLVMRFGNLLFEPLWNAEAIEHVQITVGETVGLEGRVGYYDNVGALKDMVQNHMLQLLALVAMEPPAHYSATSVRDEKVKVLRCLRAMKPQDTHENSVKGQYIAGAINGQPVAGYAEELGKPSNTETFVALKAFVDNWRWKGVPFYLRTGKRLMAKQSEIVIQYKPVPHSIFDAKGGGLQANMLVMQLQPDEGIRVNLMAKEPDLDRSGMELKQVELDVSLSAAFAGKRRRIAYERLLLDLLEGDTTLFVRRDEVEAAWTWIDSIRAAWDEVHMPVKTYTSGSWGPSAAIGLIERNGASWHE